MWLQVLASIDYTTLIERFIFYEQTLNMHVSSPLPMRPSQRQCMYFIIYQMPTMAMDPLQSSLFEWFNLATTLNLIH